MTSSTSREWEKYIADLQERTEALENADPDDYAKETRATQEKFASTISKFTEDLADLETGVTETLKAIKEAERITGRKLIRRGEYFGIIFK